MLPLVRQLSIPLTTVLLRGPLTPNQTTVLSIGAGLAGAWCLAHAGTAWALAGLILFIACQVLDSCDGEIARVKNLRSRLGGLLDDFGDWLVHAALFIAESVIGRLVGRLRPELFRRSSLHRQPAAILHRQPGSRRAPHGRAASALIA